MGDINKSLNLREEAYQTGNGDGESFFSTEGRITRSTYFVRMLLLALPIALLSLVGESSAEPGIIIFSVLFIFVLGILQIIQSLKRLHDVNLSGWYIFLSFIPIINIGLSLYLFLKDSYKGDNEFGEDPKKDTRESKSDKKKGFNLGSFGLREKTETKTNFGLNDLEKLSELRDKGVITEQEFNIKKRDILKI